jgi:NADH-quinone oxidoreductase subunit M
MIPVLLISIPLVAGIVALMVKNGGKQIAWLASIITLMVMLYAIMQQNNICNCNYNFQTNWLQTLGSSFHVGLNGLSTVLCLLTAFVFPILFLGISNNNFKNESKYYALLLLAQAGLIGVFVAQDALLFYFFWELALIPVYFLSSSWGGEKRITATFKFFIYTFLGSLLMLIALIYVQSKTADASFDWQAMRTAALSATEQNWIFALLFIAFAVKMPVFPFHTWQPDAYQQAPTSTTIVLSAVMVKMGLFGVIYWLMPLTPLASSKATNFVIVFSVIGIVYASLIATKQNNIKRLVAYSSIAHIGLMCATLFTGSASGTQAVIMQMFHHGINILGLWLVIDVVERKTGIQKMSELGGLAKTAPALTIALVVIAFANIALPLTNAFVGEFLMFQALFNYNIWVAAVAGLGIIIAAVYTLGMIQNVFYGKVNNATKNMTDIDINEKCAFAIIILFILIMGVYSQPFNGIVKDVATTITTIK